MTVPHILWAHVEEPEVKKAKKEAKVEILYEKARFTPHITAEAVTRPKGKFAVQRAVGANLNTHLLLSSTTYSVLDRLEVGTTILQFFDKEHRHNYNLKYNFYRGEQYFWSVGYNTSSYDIKIKEPGVLYDDDATLTLSSMQILLNYIPLNSNFRFGMNLNLVYAGIDGWDGDDGILLLGTTAELGVDISYSFKEPYDLTFGLGWLRESGVTALEKRAFGFGSSLRWYRPKAFLSSPTAGIHYTPSSDTVSFLFSTTFY